jgi:hypothetical protein
VSKRRFEQIERIHPGMVRMSGTLWVLCRARRSGTCKLSGSVILPGDRVYRPLTNSGFRWWRVTKAALEALETVQPQIEAASG